MPPLGKVNTNVGLKKIVEGAYLVPLGSANAVLLDGGPELALVDAGFPDKAPLVFDAIRQLGRTPRDLRHLIFTHGHPDHIGSAAVIVRETGATTYMHALDAPFAETGGPFRPMNPAPGLLPRTAYRYVWRPQERMEPVGLIATWQMEKRCQSPAGCMSSTSQVTARDRSPFFGRASDY
jgi:glyoxylase-like metal-dependent hydrolase (beta-lactamase superfamily II)